MALAQFYTGIYMAGRTHTNSYQYATPLPLELFPFLRFYWHSLCTTPVVAKLDVIFYFCWFLFSSVQNIPPHGSCWLNASTSGPIDGVQHVHQTGLTLSSATNVDLTNFLSTHVLGEAPTPVDIFTCCLSMSTPLMRSQMIDNVANER